MTDEDTVWYYTWKRLQRHGIQVIGGEPPGGSSPLPRIEMKDPHKTTKGSKGSRKCDLYAVTNDTLLLIEAKDSNTKLDGDIEKLTEIIEDPDWAGALWDAMDERRLAAKHGFDDRSIFVRGREKMVAPVLATPPDKRYNPPDGFLLIETDEEDSRARFRGTKPSNNLKSKIDEFLRDK